MLDYYYYYYYYFKCYSNSKGH